MATDTPEQHRPSPRHQARRLIASIAILSVPVVALAACGSSGTSTSKSATNSAATTQKASRADRFASLRTCLQKQGINLPQAPAGGQPGSEPPPSGGQGGFELPNGVSQAKFQEALKKCGGFPEGPQRGFNSATARAGLAKFAACMRDNGVKLPAPNTSSNGPVFNTKGIDTSSAAFKKAQQKCRGNLKGRFGAGGPPPGAGQGAPPSGAEGGRPPERP
jgi:hypothetical protein